MSIDTHIQALYSRGRTLTETSNQVGWELAEIVSELYELGQTDQRIADRFGWKDRKSAQAYRNAHVNRDSHPRFADALVYANMSDDRAVAVSAVAEVEGIAAQ